MALIDQIREHLMRPGAALQADGLPIRVRSVHEGRDDVGRPELAIRYAVDGLPDGVAYTPPDDPGSVAEELTAWATEHVRQYRPPPLATDAELSVALPGRDELWQQLVTHLDAREQDGALVIEDDTGPLTVLLTPTEWQQLVFAHERGARLDHGVDADGPGDGPGRAIEDLGETIDRRLPEHRFVVLTDRGFRASTRAVRD